MQRVCAFILLALVCLCNARSPPILPLPAPLDCNATDTEAGQVLDLINKARDEGFVLKPFRVVSAYRLEKFGGSYFFFLTVDVLETKCSVLSGKSWKNCNEINQFHKLVFGQCKAVVYISKIWNLKKLLRYNCTLSPVPAAAVVRTCPDCPTFTREITSAHISTADKFVEKYNKESNHTNYFKTYHVERVTSQWVFGQASFLQFTVKATDCVKTQSDVVLANCNFLADREADLGFCKGNKYKQPLEEEQYSVSCEIYGPKDDDGDDHHHGRGECLQGKENAEPQGDKSDLPAQDKEHPENQGAEHEPDCPHTHHGHRCRPHHHHHHQHHHGHHPHHCHHHHHHRHHDPHHHSHHDHHHGHHHHPHHHDNHQVHVKGHNHTSSEKHGSSSEEHTDKIQHDFKKSKGSVEFLFLEQNGILPEPNIVNLVPGKRHPMVSEFPDFKSPLETCPGEPSENLPEISKYFPHE